MAKYQAPEGYVLDSNTGLYYTQVIAEDAAGNKSQVVTWFNADTGEYRQDVYPVKGGANTAPPISNGANIPRPPKVDTSDDYQYYKNKNFMKGLGVFLIVCLILALLVIFFIRFIMGESSCTMSKEDYEELQQAKKEAVIDAFSSSGNSSSDASSTDSYSSENVDYSSYSYYPNDVFKFARITLCYNDDNKLVRVNLDDIGKLEQDFPNIPAKNSDVGADYIWHIYTDDNRFQMIAQNKYEETKSNDTLRIEDMDIHYEVYGETGNARAELNHDELAFYYFDEPLLVDINKNTKLNVEIYAPYWDEPIYIEDIFVYEDGKNIKNKAADLFGGTNTGSYSEDEAAMMEAAGEDYSEAPKGSAGVPNYYLGIWMDGDFNFDRASAPTMAFYENGVFEINANFLEGFCNYCGEFDVERKGSEIYLHLHDYGTANGAPATATVKFSDSNPDTCYLMDEGFGMMNYEHTAPYEFYRDTRG